jgi:hypothetical protein
MISEPQAFAQWCVEIEKGGEHGAYARVAALLNCNRTTILRLAKSHRWRERHRRVVAPLVEQRECERAAEAVASWRDEQIATGEQLRRKGLQALANLTPNTVREAHDLVKLGSELIQKANDDGSKKVEVHHSVRQLLLPPTLPPVPLPAPDRPRITVEVAEDIDDLLSDDEKRAVLEEGDDE